MFYVSRELTEISIYSIIAISEVLIMKGLPHSEHLDVVRHSLAHVMADAVVKVFAGTKVAIGPAIENGFYYDFQFPEG